MSLNLITDPWIPVRMRDGSIETIAPHRMVEPDILEPAWPRADLNLACYELLIGLVMLACPPKNHVDWRARHTPDSETLRTALQPFVRAFDLTEGDHPFLQERLEVGTEEQPWPVDKLFIDSAGEIAIKQNRDIMVRGRRYNTLEFNLAAMALYTMQAFAPSLGTGHRTSMRGGGPMVTLVDPGRGLWSVVWANVPYGTPAKIMDLPWMIPAKIFEKKSKTCEKYPPTRSDYSVEVFFGMPIRFHLVEKNGLIIGVNRKKHGNNYPSSAWRHPTSPYCSEKVGGASLPVHPKPGAFGYRNWLGIVMRDPDDKGLCKRATCIETWDERAGQDGPAVSVRVAGWAMKKARPVTFVSSIEPLLMLPEDRDLVLVKMIRVADKAGTYLYIALKSVLSKKEISIPNEKEFDNLAKKSKRDEVIEEFFTRTEPQFHARAEELTSERLLEKFIIVWICDLRKVALALFDRHSVPSLHQCMPKTQETIVNARNNLLRAFEFLEDKA